MKQEACLLSELDDMARIPNRYSISEDKLTAILDVIDRSNNQKLYRALDKTLAELRVTYTV